MNYQKSMQSIPLVNRIVQCDIFIYVIIIYIVMISEAKFNNIKDTRTLTVKKNGTSAHIYLPKEWIGKEVIVLLVNDDEE